MGIKRVVTWKACHTHKIRTGVIFHNKSILLVTGVFLIAHKPIPNIFVLPLIRRFHVERKANKYFCSLNIIPLQFRKPVGKSC